MIISIFFLFLILVIMKVETLVLTLVTWYVSSLSLNVDCPTCSFKIRLPLLRIDIVDISDCSSVFRSVVHYQIRICHLQLH